MQCKNCHLYNRRTQACHITIINAGEYYELPVAPNDDCHWERLEAEVNAALQEAIDQETDPVKKKSLLAQQQETTLNQVRAWSDGKNSYIEAPIDFMLH